ncbi:type I restriction enzyme S subunit [Sinorhizobium fredii]|uniref:Type-1 restriction enzyme MjaXIP specificity protein n=1 Tax=Sinorhizobium fredii (strain USDA 257) TaxID=1185652 RepID=I3WYU8_SINF2|nr:restriction endonuclease subunit S [Sinorhizobium fredii]AFL48804.1 type-1 restriction enzyme MjaXIP specificity protein [Sinorhizobium fredii USDA 257]
MKTEKLGNLAEFRNGLNYTDADNGSGLAVVGVSDFQDKVVIDTGNLPQLSLSALSKPDALIHEGDVLFVRSNGNRELIGRSVYVNTEPTMPTSHSGFTIRCRFHDRRCYPRYYAYLFRGSIIRQTLSSHGGGTNISNLNQQILADLDVPVPDLWMQERIAGILSAYDDLIEVNQRRIAILEDMARRLFDEWFVRFRYPGHEAVPLIETELGMVPEGWQIETARQALTYTGGGTPSKAEHRYWRDGDIQWFTPTDLTKSGQTFLRRSSLMITKEGLAKSSARLFPAFSIMMTSRATLGVFAINTEPATTNQGFITFLPSSRTPVYFLVHMLKREFPRMEAVASGATFKEITKGALGELVFAFPPETLTHRFEQLATPMMEQIATVSRQNDSLRAARDLLLPKLISGEIDLSAAEETFAEAAE